MNILIFSHGVPSKEDPQWGCFELDQARALEALGHKVIVAAVDGRFRRGRSQRGVILSEFGNIHAYLYYLFPWKLLPFAALRVKVRSWMTMHLFRVICEKEGTPDVIYAHYMFSMAGLDLVHRKHPEIPLVGIEHWSHLSNDALAKLDLMYAGIGYSLIDRLLAVSPSLQFQIKKHFGKESEVVYDMVDQYFLDVPLAKQPAANEPFRFASCGSLIPRKGFDVLLRAFSETRDKTSKLIILGAGPEKVRLQELAGELGILERVTFKGMVSRDEIREIYRRCSAYVLATKSETFGVSYVEAMAMGLPAIATRCGGPEHFMNDTCGLLVDVDDVAALTRAMDSVEEHIGDYSPEAIREYVRSRFSGEVIAKQLEQIFIEEIEKKKS